MAPTTPSRTPEDSDSDLKTPSKSESSNTVPSVSDGYSFEQASLCLDEKQDPEMVRRTLRPRSSTYYALRKRKASPSVPYGDNKARALIDPRETSVNRMTRTVKGLALGSRMSLRREMFFIAYRDHFLPLLPNNNYIKKLMKEKATLEDSHNALSSTMPHKYLQSQPQGITANLLPYQLKGLSFLLWLKENGMSGILADEMGLGKTLQTLSLFAMLRNCPHSSKSLTHLVICPLSVLQNWMNEVMRFTPNLKAFRFHGTPDQRNHQMQAFKPGAYDMLICTYESFQSESRWFKTQNWEYVVLDEGHLIKNPEGVTSKALRGLRSAYRLMLTGTPLQNNLVELWSLLNWLLPEVFDDETQDLFSQAFNISQDQGVDTEFLARSRHLLELISLRRTKESADLDLRLPPKNEIYLMVPLSSLQREAYLSYITNADLSLFDNSVNTLPTSSSAIPNATSSAGRKSMHNRLHNLVMQLRRICCHPYLMPDIEPDPYQHGDHVIHSSGKFVILRKIVEELVVRQHRKIIIFSNWTGVLDYAEELLHLLGGDGSVFRYLRMDGSTKRAGRTVRIRLFQDEGSEYRVMLITTRAGGLGINLTAASDVVFLDEDWNPQITLQAEARSHRIGQDKEVNVYKLCTRGTVEEQMLSRIRKKLYLAAKVTDNIKNVQSEAYDGKSNGSPGASDYLSKADISQLRRLLKKNSRGLGLPTLESTDIADWNFQTMVNRLREMASTENSDEEEEIEEGTLDESEWVATKEKVECGLFEGAKHERSPGQEGIDGSVLPLNRADRRKGKETCLLVDGYPVSKLSLSCDPGYAVLAGTEKTNVCEKPIREELEPMKHQNHCLVCGDVGNLIPCYDCPRSFHDKCHQVSMPRRTKFLMKCMQHKCIKCNDSATDAGGLLLRCHSCSLAYCVDCVDWERTKILHDTNSDFEALNYGPRANTWYIECPFCHNASGMMA